MKRLSVDRSYEHDDKNLMQYKFVLTGRNTAHLVQTVTHTCHKLKANIRHLFADYTSIIRYHVESNRFQNCVNDTFAQLKKWFEVTKITRNWHKNF